MTFDINENPGWYEVEFLNGDRKRLFIEKNIVNHMATPLYLVDKTGSMFNWLTIVSVRPLDEEKKFSLRPVDNIILSTKEEAERIVQYMRDIVHNYGIISVADLNNLVGLPSSDIDHKWGWDSMDKVAIRQVREGWMIDAPNIQRI